jgi:hypothetical protein
VILDQESLVPIPKQYINDSMPNFYSRDAQAAADHDAQQETRPGAVLIAEAPRHALQANITKALALAVHSLARSHRVTKQTKDAPRPTPRRHPAKQDQFANGQNHEARG